MTEHLTLGNRIRTWKIVFCISSIATLKSFLHPSSLRPSLLFFFLLYQLGLQDCWLHKANGGMVLFTFFMCRIALFPYMYWTYGRHYSIPLYSVPFYLPLSANLGNSCILAPQVYWFVLLCRKGYRLYKRSRRPDSSPAADVTDNSKDD